MYTIQDKETGTVIDTFETYAEAESTLALYESTDVVNGVFEESFYEIKEVFDIQSAIRSYISFLKNKKVNESAIREEIFLSIAEGKTHVEISGYQTVSGNPECISVE